MKETIERLLEEARQLKKSNTIEEDFAEYFEKLKRSIQDFPLESLDRRVVSKLHFLLNYTPYDQLPRTDRIVKKVLAWEFEIDQFVDWRKGGKYRSDINQIIITLDSILYRLDSRR